MKPKKWIFYWLLIVMILPIIAIFNYIIDPYQQYREATIYSVPYENGRELNSGLAKNFDYDSVIIGTSMMDNFNIEDLQKILKFKKPIKLVMPGSSVYEQSIMLNTAFKHQNVDNVLVGIDFLSYYGSTTRLKYGESFFPFYLYDENLFNDYKYLFSINTLIRSLTVLFLKADNKDVYDYNKMYEWHSKKDSDDVLKSIKKRWENRNKFDNKTKADEKKFIFLKDNFDSNLKPIIEKNPEVNFKLIFPPYSVLAFKVYEERKQLKEYIDFKIYIAQSLKNFNNVELYDFQVVNSTTKNFNNYYDLYHYKKYITKWMLEQIRLNNYNVDVNTQSLKYKIFQEDIKSYKIDESIFKTYL